LRQPSSTEQTEKTDTHHENHIDHLAENLDLSSLGAGLERPLTDGRGPSPTTLEPPSAIGSDETEQRGGIRPKAMATTTAQGGVTSSATTPILSAEPRSQMIASLSGGNRKPKAKEPELYPRE